MAKNSEFTVQTCTYFCKITVSDGSTIDIPPGIYTIESTHKESASLFLISDKIWGEDPTGTVNIIKDRKTGHPGYIIPGYIINRDEDACKEFMWVKLSAKEI